MNKDEKIKKAFESLVDYSATSKEEAFRWFKHLVATMQYDIDNKDETYTQTRRFAKI